MTAYRNVEDLPGEPAGELEFGLAVLQSQLAAAPVDDVIQDRAVYMLMRGGELQGMVDADTLTMLGARA